MSNEQDYPLMRKHLESYVNAIARFPQLMSFEKLLKETGTGRWWDKPIARVVLPEHEVKEKSQQCYLNAWRLRQRRTATLHYCEGFYYQKGMAIPVMHGWCVDRQARVVDPSVNQVKPAAYYGMIFDNEFARECWRQLARGRRIGILANNYVLRNPATKAHWAPAELLNEGAAKPHPIASEA